jgi:hypothetical protein
MPAARNQSGPLLLKVPARRKIKVYELPTEAARKDRAYKRPGSRFWQVGFWVGNRYIRRTTGALSLRGALDAIPVHRAQAEKELARDGEAADTLPRSGENMGASCLHGGCAVHGAPAEPLLL